MPATLFFGWVVGICKLHIGKLGFNKVRVYWCFYSIGIDDLFVGLKLFHIVVVCRVPPLKEHV